MKKLRLNNAVVVITGASSGIGRATAVEFAREGAQLVLAARRKRLLQDLANECKELGAEAIAVECDVSDADDVEQLADKAISKFGQIDVWVNNAGVGTVGKFEEIPFEEHEQVVQTNLLGAIYGSSVALRHFRQRGEGVLINVSSVEGKQAIAYHASYAATKHGLVGLGSALRQELWLDNERDVHVCTVMPASINTPFFRHAGNHTGHEVRPIPPVYAPEKVASIIVDVAKNPRDEVFAGGMGKMVSAQKKIAPELTSKMMAWQQKREMEKAPEAKDKSGILFEPSNEGSGAKDEFAETGKYADPAIAVLASAFPIGMGYWLWRKWGKPKAA